jgi:hypothetical protein
MITHPVRRASLAVAVAILVAGVVSAATLPTGFTEVS